MRVRRYRDLGGSVRVRDLQELREALKELYDEKKFVTLQLGNENDPRPVPPAIGCDGTWMFWVVLFSWEMEGV